MDSNTHCFYKVCMILQIIKKTEYDNTVIDYKNRYAYTYYFIEWQLFYLIIKIGI